ncbi:MAG: MlaD family protein [Pseudomonadota bacterium]
MSATAPPIGLVRGRSGLFVLVALAILVVAVFQTDVLRPWLQRTVSLRVIVPETALAGLAAGSQVQLFGTQIGEVTEVVIRPDQPFYAETRINDEVTAFIRADSQVFVRRQFGIAGAAYLEITRGRGAELDWEFAVLDASIQQAATDSLEQLVEEAKARVLPLVDELTRLVAAAVVVVEDVADPDGTMQRAITDFGGIAGDIRAGKGSIGRLLVDDSFLLELQETGADLRQRIADLDPLLADVSVLVGDVQAITADVRAEADVAGLVQSLDRALGSTDAALRSLTAIAPTLADAAEGAGDAARALPDVLVRVSQTLAQLEELLDALRRSWLIGGSGAATPVPGPEDVRP